MYVYAMGVFIVVQFGFDIVCNDANPQGSLILILTYPATAIVSSSRGVHWSSRIWSGRVRSGEGEGEGSPSPQCPTLEVRLYVSKALHMTNYSIPYNTNRLGKKLENGFCRNNASKRPLAVNAPGC